MLASNENRIRLQVNGILFNTNVLSEPMCTKPAAEVLNWFGASFFVSAITRTEILLGIALLPADKRHGNCATYALLFAEHARNGH